MAIYFLNTVLNEVGTTPVELVATSETQTVTVIGLSLCNTTSSTITASITLTDASSNTGYYIKDVQIAPNSSLRVVNGGERLVLAPNNSLKAVSSLTSSIDIIVSYAQQI
jgi:hypothetical protein